MMRLRLFEEDAGKLDELALADGEAADRRMDVDMEAEPGEQVAAPLLHRPGGNEAEARRLAIDVKIGEHRALGEEAEFLVDDADAALPRRVGRIDASPSRRRVMIVPESGRTAPARIFISVDLPAPFSPTTAWIVPRSTVRFMSASATTPP